MTSAQKPIILFVGGGDYGHIPRIHLCILSCIVHYGLVISMNVVGQMLTSDLVINQCPRQDMK
jgi:hypothetical protein